jgi:hypothetical protein
MRLAEEIKLLHVVSAANQLCGPDGVLIHAKKKKKKHKHKHHGQIINPTNYNEDEVDDLDGMLADSFNGHRAGKKPHTASYIDALADALSMSWYKGYDASLDSDSAVPVSKHKKAWRAAQARALEISRTTHKTSRKLLKADSDYVTDPMRAKRAAKYEASRAFFAGFHEANKGSGKLKSWVAMSDNPCQECEDADGEDPIDIDDSFEANGLITPPGHLNCECNLIMHSGEDE